MLKHVSSAFLTEQTVIASFLPFLSKLFSDTKAERKVTVVVKCIYYEERLNEKIEIIWI